MAGSWRGFTKERHGGTKVAVALLAVTGFGAAWASFAASHEDSPTATTPEPTPAATTTATATPAPGTTPAPTPAPTRARRSRGS